jgi:hypothetical protein
MKKILFVLPVVALLAAGCSGSQQAQTQTPVSQSSSAAQGSTGSPAASQGSPSMDPLALLTTVNVSASTNTLPYSIKIFADGSASVFVQGQAEKDFKAGTIDTVTLANSFQQVGSVGKISETCTKSISFGTITTVSYNGQTSGDISCSTSGDVYNLYLLIGQAETKLGISAAVHTTPLKTN